MSLLEQLPISELIASADDILQQHPGVRIYFNYRCAHCCAKQMFAEPYTLYTSGICEECGNITTIREGGFTLDFPD